MSYQKSITIRIDEKDNQRLVELAATKQTSKGSIIRQALRKFLIDQE